MRCFSDFPSRRSQLRSLRFIKQVIRQQPPTALFLPCRQSLTRSLIFFFFFPIWYRRTQIGSLFIWGRSAPVPHSAECQLRCQRGLSVPPVAPWVQPLQPRGIAVNEWSRGALLGLSPVLGGGAMGRAGSRQQRELAESKRSYLEGMV